jgi:hypothetical protein
MEEKKKNHNIHGSVGGNDNTHIPNPTVLDLYLSTVVGIHTGTTIIHSTHSSYCIDSKLTTYVLKEAETRGRRLSFLDSQEYTPQLHSTIKEREERRRLLLLVLFHD